MLTYEKFLELLGQTPRRWYLDSDNAIRLRPNPEVHDPRRREVQCPISSLCNYSIAYYGVAATELGIESHMRSKIVDAADAEEVYDEKVRADLLQACGL